MATIRNRVSIYSNLLSNCSNDRSGFNIFLATMHVGKHKPPRALSPGRLDIDVGRGYFALKAHHVASPQPPVPGAA